MKNTRMKKLMSAVVAFAVIVGAGVVVSSQTGGDLSNLHLTTSVSSAAESQNGSLKAKNLSDKSIQETIPKYSDSPFCNINKGKPVFSKSEITTKAYQQLGDLDSLGRCTGTLACLGKEIMPSESQERGSISEIHPTGWHSVQYKSVSGGSLYNRCHLIGWQLTGNDAIARNLITGTRYMNVQGMEPFESQVAEYLRSSGNHVMYRVTPAFKGSELVARGVHMEAYSVEDQGKGISFNIYCYNVQPNITIDYATGESKSTISGDKTGYSTSKNGKTYTTKKIKGSTTVSKGKGVKTGYVVNTNTGKFHYSTCSSVKMMSDANTLRTNESRKKLIQEGYEPCKRCNP